MLRLLRLLWTGDGHAHRWETIAEGKRESYGKIVGKFYDCRCTVCGAIKEFRT